MSLTEQRDIAISRLDELRRARAVALLDTGQVTLADAVVNVEQELASISDAEAEQVRRERAEAEAAESARLAELQGAMHASEAKRLDAISRAMDATRNLADALCDAIEANREITAAMAEIGGVQPQTHSENELVRRVTGMMAATLVKVRGRHLGDLYLRPLPYFDPADDWSAKEGREGTAGINSFLKLEQEEAE